MLAIFLFRDVTASPGGIRQPRFRLHDDTLRRCIELVRDVSEKNRLEPSSKVIVARARAHILDPRSQKPVSRLTHFFWKFARSINEIDRMCLGGGEEWTGNREAEKSAYHVPR